MGGSRRTKEEEEAEEGEKGKNGTEGRHTLWVPEDVLVYNNSITTNYMYFAAFVEGKKTTSKISK